MKGKSHSRNTQMPLPNGGMAVECTFDLDEPQMKLLLDILERERRELTDEILHTDKRAYRQKLHERLDSVHRLSEQLKAQAKIPAGQV